MTNLYSILTVLVVSFLLGMVVGMNIIAAGIRRFISDDLMVIYVNGKRIETFRLL